MSLKKKKKSCCLVKLLILTPLKLHIYCTSSDSNRKFTIIKNILLIHNYKKKKILYQLKTTNYLVTLSTK